MTGKAFQSTQVGIRKNLLINGDMSVAQRLGAIGGNVASVDWTYQSADRWKTLQKAGTGWQMYTSQAIPVGSSRRSLLFNSLTNSVKGGVIQIVENIHAVATQGRRVSLQAQLLAASEITDVRAAILGWTGAADAVTNPISAWNGSGLNPTLAASWGYLNTPSNLVTGTDWGLKKIENILVPTNITNIAVMFWSEDETQPSSAHSWVITDIQLEIGTKCTQFERLFFQDTLELCERYYEKSYTHNTAPAGNTPVGLVQASVDDVATNQLANGLRFRTAKRVTPTITIYSKVGTPAVLSDTGYADGPTSANTTDQTTTGYRTILATGMVANRAYCYHYAASAEL